MSDKKIFDRIVEWVDSRIGFTKTPLRPDPEYSMNPLYWLGGLIAVAFVMQGITGVFMLLYYTPTPTEAYSSTMYIMNSVPLGQWVETLHLYTAYAMILLVIMHFFRNYFASAHKKPREFMWLTGIALAGIVLTFGLTGYLLPWTVVSKSATDVAIGFINFVPGQLASIAKFLIAGSGSDADQLFRFLSVHTVILPAALLAFLGIKVYLFEVHGPSYVSYSPRSAKKADHWKILPWFPNIFLFLAMVGSVLMAMLFAASAIFPLVLPPEFNPQTAPLYVAQPDWYFLWMYQIVKFSFFEGPNVVYALVGIALFVAILLLLPFYDRTPRKDMFSRPVFTTIGGILVSEFVLLTVWGYLTPGQVIPDADAIALIGGIALAIIAISWSIYFVRKKRVTIPAPPNTGQQTTTPPSKQFRLDRIMVVFLAFLTMGSASLASFINALTGPRPNVVVLGTSFPLLTFSTLVMSRMVKVMVRLYEIKEASR